MYYLHKLDVVRTREGGVGETGCEQAVKSEINAKHRDLEVKLLPKRSDVMLALWNRHNWIKERINHADIE